MTISAIGLQNLVALNMFVQGGENKPDKPEKPDFEVKVSTENNIFSTSVFVTPKANPDIAGYKIYRSQIAPFAKPPKEVADIKKDSPLKWRDLSVIAGYTYQYAVAVYNQNGQESEQSEAVELTVPNQIAIFTAIGPYSGIMAAETGDDIPEVKRFVFSPSVREILEGTATIKLSRGKDRRDNDEIKFVVDLDLVIDEGEYEIIGDEEVLDIENNGSAVRLVSSWLQKIFPQDNYPQYYDQNNLANNLLIQGGYYGLLKEKLVKEIQARPEVKPLINDEPGVVGKTTFAVLERLAEGKPPSAVTPRNHLLKTWGEIKKEGR